MTRRAMSSVLAAAATLFGLASAVLYLSLVNPPEARGALLQAGPVTAVTVTLSDLKAGAASEYTVQDTTSTAGAVDARAGQIIIQFPAGTTIPTSMAASSISVTTNANITPPTKLLTVAPPIDAGTRTVTMTTPIVIANNVASSFAISSGASARFSPYKFLVPLGSSAGTKNVVIKESGGGTKSATFQLTVTALAAATLTLSPTTAVAGQTIAIIGSGFSPVSLAGGAGPNDVHQITGQGTVAVTLGGTTLTTPNLTYPINLDSNGNFVVSVQLPFNSTTLTAGTPEVKVIDSGGRTATANLTIPARTITLNPIGSGRASEVEVTGAGFATGINSVIITYAGTQVANTVPDDKGDFKVTFDVPFSANTLSSNIVTATLTGLAASASATHSVPGASVTVSPSSAQPGSLLVVTGKYFPGFVLVSSLTIGGIGALPLPAPGTDRDGAFTASIILPEAPIGPQSLWVIVGNVSAVTSVTVTKSLITAPTPTPTPRPPMSSAVALKPLLDSSSLKRVWNFNNSTKLWTFFDPRAAFADANTITEMVSGQVYWINTILAQTVTLNGKSRELTQGWNLLSW